MATELAYALITPYSLIKSRTGGIIGRMLSLTDLELIGARGITGLCVLCGGEVALSC